MIRKMHSDPENVLTRRWRCSCKSYLKLTQGKTDVPCFSLFLLVMNDRGQEITVKQPYIIDELCIGCGICETKCPLPDRAAIYITSAGEHRDPENVLPRGGGANESGLY